MKKIKLRGTYIKLIIYSIIALIVAMFIVKIPFIKTLLNLLFICFIFSYMLKPIYIYIIHKGINKRLSAIIILSAFVFTFVLSIAMVVPKIVNESYRFAKIITYIQEYVEEIQGKTNSISSNPNFKIFVDKVGGKLNNIAIEVLEKCLTVLQRLGENIVLYLTAPMIMYYFLCEGDKIKNKLLIIFAGRQRKIISHILSDLDKVLSKYILSQIVLCILVGILTYISLKLLKVEFAFILSIVNGVLNIIPYFGAPIGIIITFLVSIISSDVNWVLVIVSLIIVQNIESNLISPFLIGKSVHMHPLVVMLLLIIGEELIGVIGIIIAIPIGVILKMIYDDINYYLY